MREKFIKLFIKRWMVWICSPNEVYYVFAHRNKLGFKLEKIDDREDVRDTLVFSSKGEVESFIKSCIKSGILPNGCDRIEYGEVYPCYEDDNKFWYNVVGKIHVRDI